MLAAGSIGIMKILPNQKKNKTNELKLGREILNLWQVPIRFLRGLHRRPAEVQTSGAVLGEIPANHGTARGMVPRWLKMVENPSKKVLLIGEMMIKWLTNGFRGTIFSEKSWQIHILTCWTCLAPWSTLGWWFRRLSPTPGDWGAGSDLGSENKLPTSNLRKWRVAPKRAKPTGSMYDIYGNMDPINIPPMLAYIPYMDPMGNNTNQGFLQFYSLQVLAQTTRGMFSARSFRGPDLWDAVLSPGCICSCRD